MKTQKLLHGKPIHQKTKSSRGKNATPIYKAPRLKHEQRLENKRNDV